MCGGWEEEKTDYVQVCRRTHYSNNLECYDTIVSYATQECVSKQDSCTVYPPVTPKLSKLTHFSISKSVPHCSQ